MSSQMTDAQSAAFGGAGTALKSVVFDVAAVSWVEAVLNHSGAAGC